MLGVCTDFAPRVGACAACRAREGIGGSDTKSIVQTKSAADSRPRRLPTADGARRGASYVPQIARFSTDIMCYLTIVPLTKTPLCKGNCQRS